jgi:hypothetical protein
VRRNITGADSDINALMPTRMLARMPSEPRTIATMQRVVKAGDGGVGAGSGETGR